MILPWTKEIEDAYNKFLREEKERKAQEDAKKWAKIVESEKKYAQEKLDAFCKPEPPKTKRYFAVNVLDYKTACEVFRLAVNGGYNAKIDKQCAGKYVVSWWA